MRTLRFIAKNRPDVIFNKLSVSNLHWITGKKQIQDYFSKFGPVKEVYLKLNPDGFSSEMASVTFLNDEDAKKLLKAKELHRLDEKVIRIRQYMQ